jgi:uncharacterized membrane protein (DUF485 family)
VLLPLLLGCIIGIFEIYVRLQIIREYAWMRDSFPSYLVVVGIFLLVGYMYPALLVGFPSLAVRAVVFRPP